jgi:putative FmdB family regulatory protein
MPLFEYTCRGCGHQFEALVTGNRTPACPRCSSSELEKLYSTFGARSSGPAGRAPAGSRFT